MTPFQAGRAANMRAQILEHGLTITQRGSAWRISGKGVDFTVADLGFVQPDDLKPSTNIISQRRAIP